ncbi:MULTISPECIES: DUF3298 and DUF4163 domain-containing protein [Chryseobacterium]|uniref:DUF3298 domain-containing protein n=1 Tax=Chryseobacterium salivictor TaxID=2547600 RepID=A0A4P6ZGT4_9FLAO|nr:MULTISPECIES: DUF3298 and DUF4163 domain-containing protein [Chryseobacterium]MDQ0477715.1 hypothetical protein [Chryseobacterium sp. MDT2-18]QBO58901.1 hypothetical protein NBC122_02093 [Chryseobacterium salivictor]
MKNLLAISVAFAVLLMSCNKEKSTAETSNGTVEKITSTTGNFPLDSVKVNDSLKIDQNLTVKFQSKILVFPTLKNKALLDSIYAPKEIRLTEYSKANIADALDLKMKEFYEEEKNALQDYKPEFAQNWEKNSNMNLFSHRNNFLTVQYTGDGYTGGAHGYYFETYKVFDLQNNKTLHLSDIVANQDSKIWDPILMNNFIQNDGGKGQFEMLLVKQIPLNNNFYFDDKNLYFLYNQYEITAYAAGTVLIKVPLSDIKLLLTDEFIKRQNL